jgi:hypothetical protein
MTTLFNAFDVDGDQYLRLSMLCCCVLMIRNTSRNARSLFELSAFVNCSTRVDVSLDAHRLLSVVLGAAGDAVQRVGLELFPVCVLVLDVAHRERLVELVWCVACGVMRCIVTWSVCPCHASHAHCRARGLGTGGKMFSSWLAQLL